jgi:protein TonB
MNRTMTLVFLSCIITAATWSCAKERSGAHPEEPAAARGATSGSPDIPMIPVDVMPRVIQAPVSYPEEARSRGEEGIVHVKALVGKDGKVTEAVIESQQPASEMLGKAAVAAVQQWSFEPGKAKGEPVAVWIVVPVKFRLH